jgi:hypothetical protein
MANRTFKYVDKDRIMPVLNERIDELMVILDDSDADVTLLCTASGGHMELYRLRKEMLDGLYDWQPAE